MFGCFADYSLGLVSVVLLILVFDDCVTWVILIGFVGCNWFCGWLILWF